MTRAVVVATALLLCTDVPAGRQQRDAGGPPPAGTATLAGVVHDGHAGGTPVRRAIVRVSGGGLTTSTATDAEGRFALTRLPAGSYMLSVTKPAWVTSYHGAERPGVAPGTQIALADGEQRLDLVLPMLRGAVLAGRIVDADGLPLVGIRPVLMTEANRAGRRVLSTQAGADGSRATDENGEFRLYGLAPGTYFLGVTPTAAPPTRLTTQDEVAWARARAAGSSPTGRQFAAPPPGPAVGYAPVYYPGTVDVSAAAPITVGAGEERAGLSFRLEYVRMTTMAGTMLRADGLPVGVTTLTMLSAEADASPLQVSQLRASTRPDGSFQFPAVPPGAYELWARGTRAPGEPDAAPGEWSAGAPGRMMQSQDLWGSVVVTATGRDLTDILITLRPGFDLEGRVEADPVPGPVVDPATFGVTLRTPAELQPGRRATSLSIRLLGPEGRFRFDGLPPGEYLILGQGPRGWTTASVLVDDVEMFDRLVTIDDDHRPSNVVVTMTNRLATLTGRLTDANGQPAPAYYVLVFSTDRSAWRPGSARIRSMRPDAFGGFTFEAIPPGEYFVAALTDMSQVDWATPEVLEQFAALAVRVSIVAGETTTQDIRIAR